MRQGVREAVSRAMIKLEFSGTVYLDTGDGEVLKESAGLRDRSNLLPNQANTRFGIASGTKTFTAAAVLALVSAGVLRLDTETASIIGELETITEGVTIERLLAHTSGVFDYYDEDEVEDFDSFEVDIPWSKLATPSDYLPLFAGKQAKFPPGERMSYSNGGYILLGIIIERVTGRLFRDVVNELVLVPAGMKSSGFFPFNNLPSNTALGYLESAPGVLESNIYQLPIRGASDGGAYSTAEDIVKFWSALECGKLFPQELYRAMTIPHSRFNSHYGYGLGIYIGSLAGYPVYRMSGADVGVGFDSLRIPAAGTLFTVFSNRTEGASAIFREGMKLLDLALQGD